MEKNFLAGGGEMGALVRAFSWEETPLGAPRRWPQSLRTAVSILLNSRYPMFLFWGPQLIKIYNDGYRPILGEKHPWALGKPGTQVWPEIWEAIGPMVERVVRDGEATWSDDLRLFMRRRGFPEEVFFTFSYSPVRDESGGIGGMFCACTETTAKVQGERRLKLLRDLASAPAEARSVPDACQRSAEVLAGLPADIPFALLYLYGADGPVLAATAGVAPGDEPRTWPRMERALVGDLGARFAHVPQGPWEEPPVSAMVLPLEDRAQERATGAVVLGVSSRAAWDEGYRGFFELVAGQLASSIAAARASEEERRRAEALAELDRAKTVFFSNVSHEFRTPLTLMLGPVEELIAGGDRREELQVVQRNGQRLLKLVNTLLDFARIEAGRAQASYAPTDLPRLTAELASSFRSACERAGLALEVDCPPGREPAWVDREMWEKIVLNLLSNAFKFTLKGAIAVSLREKEEGFELAVRDTGSGIAAGALPRVFERFHRVEGARGRSHEGSGIGLALVQELVKLHGGSIGVESIEGRGSTFTVRIPRGRTHLPAERMREAAPAPAAPRAEAYVLEAMSWLPGESKPPEEARASAAPRVLLADDNADLREYARRLLAAEYDVEAVADGEAALAAARARRPELVVSDVMMPGLDGFGLLRALRADPALRTVPVILLSARAGEEARLEGLGGGADDYLVKPFSARELLVRVGALLRSAEIRREAQKALRKSERRYRTVLGLMPAAVYTCEAPHGAITYYNEHAARLWGRAPGLGDTDERFCGSLRLWRPDGTLLPHAAAPMALAMREGRAFRNEEVVIERPDGSRITVLVNIDPLRDEDGNLVGAINVFHDVSERRQAEEALRESEARYRAVVESQAEMVCRFRMDGTILFVNGAYAHARGTTAEALAGANFWDFIPEADRVGVRAMLEHLTPEAPEARIENRFQTTEGERWTLWTNRALAFDADRRVLEAQSTGVDITERKRMEAALREADRAKDEFLATLSHELRNPLAPLRNSLHLLRRADAERAQPIHDMMERQVNHLVRLVDDLMEMSRVARGSLELRREAVTLQAVLKNAIETSEPLISDAGHRLQILLPAETLPLEADPVRLGQVFANILNNAARYTPARGDIRVEARREHGEAVVEISDTGEGIEPAELPRLFEMFSQGERTSRRSQGGLGIGLAIVRRLVQMHGGSVLARSEGRGKGSCFTVRLPLGAAAGSAPHGVGAESAKIAPHRVLVVDDNRDAANSLGMLLGFLGADVAVAHDGTGALEAFERYRPDIVLLDIGMPGMNGYDVARAIRRRPQGEGVALVALTGWGQEQDRRRAHDAGFDHHFIKPADIGALQSLLSGLTLHKLS